MTNDKDGAGLLPCPFCGGEAFTVNDHVECTGCPCELGSVYNGDDGVFDSAEDAIDAWNRRAALKSHGQAFDAAGVREACAKEADGNVMSGNDQWSAGHDAAARKIAHAIRSLPLS